MSNWVNKHFHKTKSIKVLLFDEGQKQTAHYVIPSGNIVNIKRRGSYVLDKQNFFIDEKKFITYVFGQQSKQPTNPLREKDQGDYSPQELQVALESHVANEILNYSKKGMDINIVTLLLFVVMIVGFFLVYYTLSGQITDLKETLTPITEVAYAINTITH